MSNCLTISRLAAVAFSLAAEGEHSDLFVSEAESLPLGICVHPASNLRFFHEVALEASAVGPVHLALASPVDHPDDRLHRGKL